MLFRSDMGGREDLLARFAAFAADPKSPVTLTVTHHIEEIPAGTTHVMMLKDGAVAIAAPIEEALNAENLQTVFGVEVELSRINGRYFASRR